MVVKQIDRLINCEKLAHAFLRYLGRSIRLIISSCFSETSVFYTNSLQNRRDFLRISFANRGESEASASRGKPDLKITE